MNTQIFDRNLLPEPATFYARQLSKLQPARGRWAKALCCFHTDKNPSLSVNLENGGFVCFSCGARGGDVLDFYRKRHNVDFKTAANALGAMGGGIGIVNYRPPKEDRGRKTVRAFRKWEAAYMDHVCSRLRIIGLVITGFKNMNEVEKYSGIFHYLSSYEYHYGILRSSNDEAKHFLFREVGYGGI